MQTPVLCEAFSKLTVRMSLKIELREVSKRFKREWILKKVTHDFEEGQSYAVSGPNGSGKSTLLRILAGYLTPSKGKVRFFQHNKSVDLTEVYQYLSYAAPYIDLIGELTLAEMINFHQQFKSFQDELSTEQIIVLLDMKSSRNKPVKNFSSGMKQRLKLALNICTDTPILLLDEPTSNLDQQGVNWYLSLIDRFKKDRLVIIASNVPADFQFCKHQINILDFK
jgi:ABC-type multidrug transport system ATPase subunit